MVELLQSSALPLGYIAITSAHEFASKRAQVQTEYNANCPKTQDRTAVLSRVSPSVIMDFH